MTVSKKTVHTIYRADGTYQEIHHDRFSVTLYGFWADGSENGEVELVNNTEDLSDLVAALMDIQMNKTNKENI